MKNLIKRPESLLIAVYLICFGSGLLHALFGMDPARVLNSLPDLCIFHRLTGYKCPGCGMTHAFLHLGRFELFLAMKYNIFSVFLFYGGLFTLFFKSNLQFKLRNVHGIILSFPVVLYWIVRNFNWIP